MVDLLDGSYVESSVLTISPSVPPATASSRKPASCSTPDSRDPTASCTSPGLSTRLDARASLRSDSGLRSSVSPSLYRQSNANRQTGTVTSAAVTVPRLRVESTWNGRILPDARSMATTSASSTSSRTPGARALRTASATSGYLPELSSELRE